MQKCLLCKKSIFTSYAYVSGKVILKCENCNLIQTKNFVSPDYSHYHRDNSYSDSEKFTKFFFEKRLSLLKPYIPQTGVVVEIGSSTGIFLDLFKSLNWKTIGIEPSDSALVARRKGHRVFQKSFEDTKLKKESIDLIIANHVLEHVTTPQLFLEHCHFLLKKGGILFIDVPNAGSLSAQFMKNRWPYYLPSEHRTHFTDETLQKFLIQSGFKPLLSKTKSGIFEVSNPVAYLGLELFSLKKNFFRDLIHIPLDILSELTNRGDSISIISKK